MSRPHPTKEPLYAGVELLCRTKGSHSSKLGCGTPKLGGPTEQLECNLFIIGLLIIRDVKVR